jgi:hypothetical protein
MLLIEILDWKILAELAIVNLESIIREYNIINKVLEANKAFAGIKAI